MTLPTCRPPATVSGLGIVVKKVIKKAQSMTGLRKVAPPAGLEPATCGLTVRRSTN